MLNDALALASRGWPVFPVEPRGKRPVGRLVPNGVKQATTDEAQIRAWWADTPDANIGLACGAPGPDVLDVDNPDAADPRIFDLADVPMVETSRGMHFYFDGTDGRTVTLPYGEVRRSGAYVIAAPSVHESGVVYKMARDGATRPAPAWIDAGRKTAGAGEQPQVERVPPGSMYDHLLDLSVRLARSGMTIPAAELALDAEFERVRVPGAEYGGTPDDTRRLAAAPRDIRERETAPPPEPPDLAEVAALDMSVDEVLNDAGEEVDWLIPGVIPRGYVVKIAGREKVGKGTLTFHLIGALERREETVFGEAPERAVKTLVYTEEPPSSIAEKLRYANIRDARILFAARLVGKTWPEKVVAAIAIAEARGCEVLFIDNISRAASVTEESGREAAEKIEMLAEHARAANLTLIFDHHHRKGAGAIEDMSRGSTSIAGATDVNIEIERAGEDDRRITSRGRLFSTIWDMDIRLDPDRGSYSITRDRDAEREDYSDRKSREKREALEKFGTVGATAADFTAATGLAKPHASLNALVADGWATKGKRGRSDVWIWKDRESTSSLPLPQGIRRGRSSQPKPGI